MSNKELGAISGGGIITVEKIPVLTGIPGYKIKVLGVTIFEKAPIPT